MFCSHPTGVCPHPTSLLRQPAVDSVRSVVLLPASDANRLFVPPQSLCSASTRSGRPSKSRDGRKQRSRGALRPKIRSTVATRAYRGLSLIRMSRPARFLQSRPSLWGLRLAKTARTILAGPSFLFRTSAAAETGQPPYRPALSFGIHFVVLPGRAFLTRSPEASFG